MSTILKNLFLMAILAGILTGCPTKQTREQDVINEQQTALPFIDVVTFKGTIPCEDCLRVDITLNLRPDTIYQLRKTYITEQGADTVESQTGKWRYEPKDRLVILGKEKGALKTYLLEETLDRLLFVDWEGADATSQIQYALERSEKTDPFNDIVKIRGMFSIIGGNATLKECSSGVDFMVRKEKHYTIAAQNYLNTPHERNKPVLISILGRMAGNGNSTNEIIIEQYRKFYPNKDCDGNKTRSSLTGTYWMPIEIDNQNWSDLSGGSSAFLLLNADNSFESYSACNKITGTYLVKSEVLLINREVGVRLACPDGMEKETLFIEALDDSETYRIDEDILELIDQNEKVRARFLAGS